MSARKAQSYANYKRRHAPFHFFVIPVLITNTILAAVYLVRHPGLAAALPRAFESSIGISTRTVARQPGFNATRSRRNWSYAFLGAKNAPTFVDAHLPSSPAAAREHRHL